MAVTLVSQVHCDQLLYRPAVGDYAETCASTVTVLTNQPLEALIEAQAMGWRVDEDQQKVYCPIHKDNDHGPS